MKVRKERSARLTGTMIVNYSRFMGSTSSVFPMPAKCFRFDAFTIRQCRRNHCVSGLSVRRFHLFVRSFVCSRSTIIIIIIIMFVYLITT